MPILPKTIAHQVGDRVKLSSNHSKVGTIERTCLLGIQDSVCVAWDDEPGVPFAVFGTDKVNNDILIDPSV